MSFIFMRAGCAPLACLLFKRVPHASPLSKVEIMRLLEVDISSGEHISQHLKRSDQAWMHARLPVNATCHDTEVR